MEPDCPEQTPDFKRKRHSLQIAIRRQNRNNIFMHRRACLPCISPPYQSVNLRGEEEWPREGTVEGETREVEWQMVNRVLGEGEVGGREWQIVDELPIIVDEELEGAINDIFELNPCVSDLAEAIQSIKQTQDAYNLHRGIIIIRKLVGRGYNEEIIQKLIESGVLLILRRLVEQEVFKQLQLQAQWILANITYSDSCCDELVEMGFMQLMIKALRQKEKYFVHTALIALGNFCFSSSTANTIALGSTVIQDVIDIASDTLDRHLFQNCVWTVITICKNLSQTDYPKQVRGAFMLVCEAIRPGFVRDEETFHLCLNYIYRFARSYEKEIVESGLIGRLMKMSQCKGEEFYYQRFTAMKILSVLSEGEEDIAEILFKEGILQSLLQILVQADEPLIIEALYTLSNLAANTQDHVDQIFKCGQLLSLCRMLFDNRRFTEDVCHVLVNLSRFGNSQCVFDFYQSIDVIALLFDLLSQEHLEDSLQKVGLQLLQRVLALGEEPELKVSGENIARQSFVRKSGAMQILARMVEEGEGAIGTLAKSILLNFFLEFADKV